MMCCTCGTSTSFLNCLEHERLSLNTTDTATLFKSSTWGISTENAQFALCVPAVLDARTAGACRCMKQRRQPPSKNCNNGNSTVFGTVWTNLTCQAQQRACQHLSKNCPWTRKPVVAYNGPIHCPRTAPVESRRNSARGIVTSKYCVTVLLVHTGHDAEHLGPGVDRREHNARCTTTSKTSIAGRPLSLSTTSAARKRGGTRRPPLPPLLPLPLTQLLPPHIRPGLLQLGPLSRGE